MRRLLILFIILVFARSPLISQTDNTVEMTLRVSIPAVALIDFVGGDKLVSFKSPNQVEQLITPTTLNKTWINYSSIVEDGKSNYITVHMTSGNLPSETTIKLKIGSDVGAGAGQTGNPSSEIELSRYSQNIITNIGSCYTGRGAHKGHQLTYVWENIEDYAKSLYSKGDYAITVVYTITSTE